MGNHLCTALTSRGYRVRAFDIAKDMKMLHHIHDKIEMITGDFSNETDVRAAIEGMDVIFHLVSTTIPSSSNQNMAYDIETNLVPTVNMLHVARESGIRKVLFASSGGTVYGEPVILPVPESHPCNPIVSYGIMKFAIERYMEVFNREFGLKTLILRIGNPYGHRHYGYQQGIISVFLKRIKAKESLAVWGDGTIIRDYIHIDDVVNAFMLALEYEGEYNIFNIGSGNGASINGLIEIIEKIVKVDLHVAYEKSRLFDIPKIYLDISLARQELQWSPLISIEQGIEHTWHDIQANESM